MIKEHDVNKFKVGDVVKVSQVLSDGEYGNKWPMSWDNCWISYDMDGFLGKEYKIFAVSDAGYCFYEDDFQFPSCCLELVA